MILSVSIKEIAARFQKKSFLTQERLTLVIIKKRVSQETKNT